LAILPFSNRSFRKAFFILWTIWFALSTYTLYSLGINLMVAIKDSLCSLVIIALFCWLIANNLAYYQPKENKYIFIIVWCLVLAFLSTTVLLFILPQLVSNTEEYHNFLHSSIPIRFGFSFLLIGWMAMIGVLWYNQQEKEELEKRRQEADRLSKEAELSTLREKLQPHFLFNSLNSISALTFSKPQEARKMIQQLSDFLRGTIKRDDELTTLEAEISHLKLYLDIEKVRFGHRLNTIINCNTENKELKVPPMILQPLLENAIKFGLYDTLEDVTITINCSSHENTLYISIHNPFDPNTAYPHKGTGFGLASIKRRLSIIYNRKDLLEARALNHEFITTLTIPQT
jgi:hypothetical protein